MRTPLKTAACAVALAALLSGCGMFGGDDGGDGGGTKNDGQAAQEPGSAPEAEDVVGEATFTTKYGSDAKFEIHALRVRGELLQMDFSIAPERPKTDNSRLNLYSQFGNVSEFAYLVDTRNLRRHSIVRDGGNDRLAPDIVKTSLSYDAPTRLSIIFAAPEEDTEAMDVYFYEFPPIMNVPVTRSEGDS
ncbi:hypothetical protein HNR23_002168 [Nocardiopsis mwathae]|uniref:DUF4352 domain-containing protein n=1 Tax=Nocardiopsis mwathae TaxID=1472723 RepID=A0A7W9YHA0_9ACTN|nr:hypothetical protein [Nocardiopsis mwathae]MBB6172108.1 hypothetical protein [Nocardiopsis mwathae]